MTKIIKKTAIVVLTCFLFLGSSVFAAETFFEAASADLSVGSEIEIKFFINTQSEYVNAVEGVVTFPSEILELKEINDGDSLVNFWVDRPVLKNGNILFSGIIPGGYIGGKGLIFKTIFRSVKEGKGNIHVGGIKALLNDGIGTEVNIKNYELKITSSGKSIQPSLIDEKIDTDIPEDFIPVVSRDESIFGGKYFLVFATQDKGSGIERYEIREGKGNFLIGESPYVLRNQKLDAEITVKAVDRNSNERVVVLPAAHPMPWYKNYLIVGILIAVILSVIVCTYLRKLSWKKNSK